MQPAPIDRATLDRLVALGTRKGGLTTDDLAAALPIDTMEPTDIALVVADLEERGVPVELDDAFLLGAPRDRPIEPGFELPQRRSDAPKPAAPVEGTGTITPGAAETRRVAHGASGRPGAAHKAVALGGALALIVIGAIVVLVTQIG